MKVTKTTKDLSILVCICLLITLLIWLPHLLRLPNFFGLNFSEGFNTIYRNYDGLEYVVIAKSLYSPEVITHLPQSLPDIYYAAHFPLYALLILAFPFLGMLKAMIFVTLLFTIASAVAFYFLVRDFHLSEHPLILSTIFLILPARWLIVHSVGSSEPIFIFFAILTIYFLMKFEQVKNYSFIVFSAIFGSLAQLTRPPGVLLFIAIGLYVLWKIISQKQILKVFNYLPLVLMPLSLLGIFYWFKLSYNDFFAYFHTGDNIHLVFPPFQIFNKDQYWVGDIWLEDAIYIFVLGFLAGFLLLKKKLYLMGSFVLTYLLASVLIAHRDVSRYILPVFPFALIAFEKVLTSKEFRIVLIIVGLGIYLYAQNFILGNTAPYPNPDIFN